MGGFDAGLQRPVIRSAGFLDLVLREMQRLQLRAGQGVQTQREAGVVLQFVLFDDQALAGTARQQRDLRVHPEDFQHLFCVRKESRRHEHEPEPDAGRAQLVAQRLGPPLQPGFIEVSGPMGHG